MEKWKNGLALFAALLGLPVLLFAQDAVASDIQGLQGVLDHIYNDMLPLCSSLIGVGQGIAGFAATWYIAYRVWKHIAHAEPIDVYPLFRPFVIGFCAMVFPSVIALMNGILQPTVTATNALVSDSNAAIAELLAQKEQAVENSDFYKMYVGPDGNGDRDKWYQYTHPDDPADANEGMFESIGNDIQFAMSKMNYNFRNSIKEMMSELLQVLYEAASLCINTIRTFYLIVLAILGPLVFALSIFDGLRHALTAWIARYINVFLWLPVANIFGSVIGKVQEQMIQLDINQVQANGDTYFSSTDTGYLIFLIIGIIGYFTVPSVANYIVNAGGSQALIQKVSSVFGTSAVSLVEATGSGLSITTPMMTSAASGVPESLARQNTSKQDCSAAGGNNHLANKISGIPSSGQSSNRKDN